jgi:hypothetical protein
MKHVNDTFTAQPKPKAEGFQNFDLSLDLDLSDFDAEDLRFNFYQDDYEMSLN